MIDDPHRRLLHPMYRARIAAPRARDPLPETPSTPGRRTSVLSLVPPALAPSGAVDTTAVPLGVPVGTSGRVPVGIPVSGQVRIARRLPTLDDDVQLEADGLDEDEWAHLTMSRSQMCPVVRRVKMKG